ncbi:MAG: hypothetical protein ACLR9W_16635 [Enterobacter hormaechei]
MQIMTAIIHRDLTAGSITVDVDRQRTMRSFLSRRLYTPTGTVTAGEFNTVQFTFTYQ